MAAEKSKRALRLEPGVRVTIAVHQECGVDGWKLISSQDVASTELEPWVNNALAQGEHVTVSIHDQDQGVRKSWFVSNGWEAS